MSEAGGEGRPSSKPLPLSPPGPEVRRSSETGNCLPVAFQHQSPGGREVPWRFGIPPLFPAHTRIACCASVRRVASDATLESTTLRRRWGDGPNFHDSVLINKPVDDFPVTIIYDPCTVVVVKELLCISV